jgi:hypothetical protein
MRAVVVTGPGKVELSFMFLPTFIGQNNRLKMEIEEKLGPELVGKDLTGETLDWAHERVLDIICEKFAVIKGLRDYLDAIKFVDEAGST